MRSVRNQIDWITGQRDHMVALVERWASLNSGTFNALGVRQMAQAVLPELAAFAGKAELISVPPAPGVNARGERILRELGPVLSLRCRPQAARRILLAIHLDTVYGSDSDFQSVHRDQIRMQGPGVTDAKGGIAVLLTALEALERFLAESSVDDFGWEVLLNPDEEIGSLGSGGLLRDAARRNGVGLLFEPALPDGGLAAARKGSANFHIVCHGKSAHAGRHFEDGRNAIAAAAQIALRIHGLNGHWNETTFNVGRIDGGGPLNIVPDVAVVGFNVRYSSRDLEAEIDQALTEIIDQATSGFDIRTERHGEFNTPPKPADGPIGKMYEQAEACANELGFELNFRPTGGVCDGNRLAAWGLPNLDTLGVRGGGIHSREEYLLLDSLTERASLTAGLLIGWASRELPWPVAPAGDGSTNPAPFDRRG